MGIGGWKTFPAKYVDQYGIGDCKALSNYTMALLKSVGIKSYCAGVYSGEYSQNVIVPSNITMNFNHEILCVPMQKDTIWLECTSQALPTGYLSSFTSNRYALLSTQEGGKLVKIPSYSHHQNKIEREITISVDEKPTQSMLVKAKYSGTEMEDRIDLLRSTFNDQKKSILNEAKINSNQITAYDLQFSNEDKTSITETIKFGESNLIPKNTDSYICQPIIWGGNYKILPPNPERKCPVEISWNYIEQDTIIYEFNSPVIAEKIAPVHFSFVSGQYSLEQKVETNRLIWIRKLEFFNGIYPKEIYPELVRFMKNIRKSDKKICLVNVIK